MINLLPQQQKKTLAMEKIQKKVLIIFVFASIALACFTFVLYCVMNYVNAQVESVKTTVANRELELQSTDFENFRQEVVRANQGLAKIRYFWGSQVPIVPLLETLSNLTPSSIYFTNLSFGKDMATNQFKCNVSGMAQTRGALFYFKQNLETEKTFADVYFIPSSWVKPTEVNFGLSFNLVPE